MPVVEIHEEVHEKMRNFPYSSSLLRECVLERKNPDMVCGIIRVFLKYGVLSEYVDASKIKDADSRNFYLKQFDRAVTAS